MNMNLNRDTLHTRVMTKLDRNKTISGNRHSHLSVWPLHKVYYCMYTELYTLVCKQTKLQVKYNKHYCLRATQAFTIRIVFLNIPTLILGKDIFHQNTSLEI